MIIRIAYFDRTSPVGREWITEALSEVGGVRSAFHAAPSGGGPGYVSVSIFDDMSADERAVDAIAARREELGIESSGPDRVEYFEVTDYVQN